MIPTMKHILSLAFSVVAANAVSVSVSGAGGFAASPLMYGLMFEDISHSGDGGIYAELIQNRAFQNNSIDPWTSFGGATIELAHPNTALSSALPNAVSVRGHAKSEVGISNPGYWGIEVKPQKYTGSFYVLGSYDGEFKAALRSSSGEILASATIPSKSGSNSWTKHTYTLNPSKSAGIDNVFTLTFSPKSSSETLYFGLISLFPPTYNNRPNGMRIDIMEALKELNPSFLRFPGGNNLEGNTNGSEWKWQETIGDLTQRPGREGTWGYYNTDGLGLVEYMFWCQDLGMEPLLAFPSGLYLDGTVVPESGIPPLVTSALDELEFLMGDASTTYGKKRIALGYPQPFSVKYVEIGNEDNLYDGLASYNSYRFQMFYDAISAKYPDIEIIASTNVWTYQKGNSAGDYHDYSTPDSFVQAFTQFDNASATHKQLIGEYAAVQAQAFTNGSVNWDVTFEPYPWWVGAVSEAIYEIGAERNQYGVIGMSYAPTLVNVNDESWFPDLIAFNADSTQTSRSTSHHQIKLFSNNRFTEVFPSGSPSDFGPAYWVTGVNSAGATDTYILKAAIYNTTSPVPFKLNFPGLKSGQTASLTVLTSNNGPYGMDYPGGKEVVDTTVTTIKSTSSGFEFDLPEWSIAVLTWKTFGGLPTTLVTSASKSKATGTA